MSKGRKIIIIISVCVFVLLVGIALGGYFLLTHLEVLNTRDNSNPQKQEEMLSTTLEWGRLAPLPDSNSQFQISTDGSPFTRSFRSSFYVAKADLDNWVSASPGLQDAVIQTVNDTTKKYTIKPGGGAMYAEAIIDFDRCFVETYVYWS